MIFHVFCGFYAALVHVHAILGMHVAGEALHMEDAGGGRDLKERKAENQVERQYPE